MNPAARNGTLLTAVAFAAAAAFFMWKASVKDDAEGDPMADSPVAAPEPGRHDPLSEGPAAATRNSTKPRVRPAKEAPANRFYETRRSELLGKVAEMREAGLGYAHPDMREAVQTLQILEAQKQDPVSKRPPEGVVQSDIAGLHLFDGPPIKVWTVADTTNPAWAMLLPGDEIVAVDGQNMLGATLDEVLAAIENGTGETVALTVRSSRDSASRECLIQRQSHPQGTAADTPPEE